MDEKDKMPPYAVIIDVRPTDFIAGGETGVGALSVLRSSGDYSDLLPDEETQYNNRFDSFSCVSFSALNDVETVFNFKLAHNLFPATAVQWLKDNGYIDYRTGKINFADRFTAKMSGTTKNGNSLGAVGDSIRNHGLVPEAMWPWPKELVETMEYEQMWSLYFAEIPQKIKYVGEKFAEIFDIKYQWVVCGTPDGARAILKEYLKYGPVQIASAVCAPWNSTDANPPIKGCGCGVQHATMIYGMDDVAYKDFDHYRSYRKLLAIDYCIPYAVQYYVNIKAADGKPTAPSIGLVYGAKTGAALTALQKCLQYLKNKNGVPYMKFGVFGPFGPQTRDALAKFQLDNNIQDSPQGTHYGPRTRKAMTTLLS